VNSVTLTNVAVQVLSLESLTSKPVIVLAPSEAPTIVIVIVSSLMVTVALSNVPLGAHLITSASVSYMMGLAEEYFALPSGLTGAIATKILALHTRFVTDKTGISCMSKIQASVVVYVVLADATIYHVAVVVLAKSTEDDSQISAEVGSLPPLVSSLVSAKAQVKHHLFIRAAEPAAAVVVCAYAETSPHFGTK
jgi:hypothetical protein